MNIQCINNDGFEDFLTAGTVYKVEAMGVNGYRILTDKTDRIAWFGECKFKVLTERAGLTLSGQEIKDLAEYCGFQIVPESIEQDFLEGDFYVEKCPLVGVAGDDGIPKHYGHVVTCDGCEGNECMPLGEPKQFN